MKILRDIILGIIMSILMFICSNVNATNVDLKDRTNVIDTLCVNVPSNIHFYKTDEFGISIQAPNQYIYDNINWSLKDSLLVIDFNDHNMIDDQLINPNEIRINIGLPEKVKCIKTNPNLQISKSI